MSTWQDLRRASSRQPLNRMDIEEEIEEGAVTGAEHGMLEEYAEVITEVRLTLRAPEGE